MSGESQRSDDPDFFDDDFVIEDLTGKQEDLEQLFSAPSPPVRPAADAPPDAEDLLFTDHTEGLQPSERFSSNKSFAEDAPSQWTDDGLDLESVGVPSVESELEAEGEVEAGLAADARDGDTDPVLRKAEADFTDELGSLLRSEEEFGLDSDQELEVVGGTPGDGVSEFEQSGPFVLDDGEGAWQLDAAAASSEAETEPAAEPMVETSAEAAGDEALEPELVAVDAEPVAEGWEPLPATDVNEFPEVDGIECNDGQSADVAEPELVGAAAAIEGHDIYSEQPALELVGARRGGGRQRTAWLSLAASLALIGGAAAGVLRPEWFGLAIEPQRVEQVLVARPAVKVTVPPPAAIGAPQVAATAPIEPSPSTSATTDPKTAPVPDPLAVQPPTVIGPEQPAPSPTTAITDPSQPATVPIGPVPIGPGQVDPVATVQSQPGSTVADKEVPPAGIADPVATVPPLVEVPASVGPASSWPAAQRQPTGAAPTPKHASPLVRFGENLMVGDIGPAGKPANVVEGVLPGSRAFAQLSNGNYFIGSVKFADANRVTLRVDDGEVTLATAELTRFTALGSSDYDELQAATSGFVRLTNNNRLVGGILSRIADDYIVLQFRSNRVMLPRSAVGEVVRGEDDAGIRLDVTRAENDWVRLMVERELGTGGTPAETEPGELPKPLPLGATPATVQPAAPPRPASPAGGGRH